MDGEVFAKSAVVAAAQSGGVAEGGASLSAAKLGAHSATNRKKAVRNLRMNYPLNA